MLSVDDLGAAIERAGRHVDALSFYEAVLKGEWGADEDVRKFARGRWFVSKDKVAGAGNKNARQRHQQELYDAAARLGLTQEQIASELARLPRFPHPGRREESFIFQKSGTSAKLAPQPEGPPAVLSDELFELTAGGVKLTGRCLRSKKRVNLTGDGLVCKLKIEGSVLVCESEELGVTEKEADGGWKEWRVDQWELLIRGRIATDGLADVIFATGSTELRRLRM